MVGREQTEKGPQGKGGDKVRQGSISLVRFLSNS